MQQRQGGPGAQKVAAQIAGDDVVEYSHWQLSNRLPTLEKPSQVDKAIQRRPVLAQRAKGGRHAGFVAAVHGNGQHLRGGRVLRQGAGQVQHRHRYAGVQHALHQLTTHAAAAANHRHPGAGWRAQAGWVKHRAAHAATDAMTAVAITAASR